MIPVPNFTNKIELTLDTDRIIQDSHGLYSDNGILDWFYAFVKMCQEILSLTVQKGPGTSLGIIQEKVGFLQYQFDTDWNDYILYPECPQPLSPWEGMEKWDKSNDPYVTDYGIDFVNHRFDTIIWFSKPNEVNPIGIRFKYPLITGRDIMTPFWYYTEPVFMPWQDKAMTSNQTKIIPLESFETISAIDWAQRWDYDWAAPIKEKNVPLRYRDQGYSASMNTGCYSLGDKYYFLSNASNKLKFSDNFYPVHTTWSKDFNTPTIPTNTISIDTDLYNKLVVLRVADYQNYLSLIYGNFEANEDDIVDSYVILNNIKEVTTHFSNFVISHDSFWDYPNKVVVRPMDDMQLSSETRISRVVLPNSYNNETTFIPTASLFQVFSFSSYMYNTETYDKIFLDNNNVGRFFKLINFGNFSNSKNFSNSTLIAIEKDG